MMRRWRMVGLVLGALLLVLVAAVVALNFRDESPAIEGKHFEATPALVERGAYLARAGNCVACHTMRGGAPYAGGRPIETPYGTVYGTNITPDPKTGIGSWSAAEFWRALHNGRAKDGRFLVPAFPYTSFTLVTREDSDALYAYLRTLPPVQQANRPHALRFPYDTQVALALWRALFFRPGVNEPDASQSAEWNRGRYLVMGLGHCDACHGSRQLFGTGGALAMSGGISPIDKWYAPSLRAADEAGVSEWETDDVVDLLKNGVSARGSALGPMAEVVFKSTQHLSNQDLRAMAVFLKTLPRPPAQPADAKTVEQGRSIYRERCEGCHGVYGEGASGAYPALAGNRSVVMEVPANVIRAVLSGGFQPATSGNPRPWGMPPFGHVLNDTEVAAVITYIRNAWGNRASPVNSNDVQRLR
jgi:mono/diheme cytochrome c family protein